MEKTVKTRESSDLYRKIDALRLTELDRLEVMGALKAAARLQNVFHSGAVLLIRIGGWLTPNPQLKHQ